MKKTYVIDTNVFLDNPNIIYSVQKNDVIIPYKVLEELDKHKYSPGLKGVNARDCGRIISKMLKNAEQNNENLKAGIKLEHNKVYVRSHKEFTDIDGLDESSADECIIKVALGCSKIKTIKNVVLLSNDNLLRIKANSLGLSCESYEENVEINSTNDLYVGYKFIQVDESTMEIFYQNRGKEKYFPISIKKLTKEKVYPNEFIILSNEKIDLKKKPYPLLKYTGTHLEYVNEKKLSGGKIKALNLEQSVAMDLLLDKDIPLVTMTGTAGSGKTLLALAAAMDQVVDHKMYQNIVIVRPLQAVGKEVGYLPGPQPYHAKILTPTGWTTMGQVKAGDKIITRNGSVASVIETFEKGNRNTFTITFEDGATTEACEEHLWNVYDKKYKSFIPNTISTKQIGELLKNNEKCFIDFVEPVQYEKRDLPLNPYVLGTILGDGCVSQKKAIELSTTDQHIFNLVNEKINVENHILKLKRKGGASYNFINKNNIGCKKRDKNVMNEIINNLGLRGKNSHTKFIPEQYLYSSIEDRIELLQGLMDTDGYVDKTGSDVNYVSVSKQLIEDFKTLVLSLGGYCNIHRGKRSYNASVSFWNGIIPFTLPRKVERYKTRMNLRKRQITKITPTGNNVPVKCIMIDNPEHLYITDNFIVTHNTLDEKLAPWLEPIKDNLRYILSDGNDNGKKSKTIDFNMKHLFENGTIEMNAMTFIRGRSINNAFMIIDEAQNISEHEIKTILTRVGKNTKIIINGDISQIDRYDLDSITNGLSVVIEKFKHFGLAGHVTFNESVRSEIAELAAKIL